MSIIVGELVFVELPPIPPGTGLELWVFTVTE